MKLKPTRDCFGIATLTAGVEAICFFTLVACLLVISVVSSAEPMQFLGLTVPPTAQVIAGCWAFIGIPLSIMAGVGALYNVTPNLQLFFGYLLVSFFIGATIPVGLLLTGSVCSVVVDKAVQQMGSAFVCGFTDAFIFMWSILIGVAHAYTLYVVWSACQEAQSPEKLLRYERALREVQAAEPPPGPMPLPADRARTGPNSIPPDAPARLRDPLEQPPTQAPYPSSVPSGGAAPLHAGQAPTATAPFAVPATSMPGMYGSSMPGAPQADVMSGIPTAVRAYASEAQGMPPSSSFNL